MASEVDICNMAMSHLGNRARITSISPPDQTVEALHCAAFYPLARDVTFEAGAYWRFARRRADLTLSVNTLIGCEWAYAYELPTSFIKALKVVPPGAPEGARSQDFVIETDAGGDDVLYSNTAHAVLHYIFREVNAGRYSPMFTLALSHQLASMTAGPILKGKVGMLKQEEQSNLFRAYVAAAAASQMNQRQVDSEYRDHKAIWISDR